MKTDLGFSLLVAALLVLATSLSAQTQPAATSTSANQPAKTLAERNAQLSLERAGYQGIGDMTSGPKGIAAKVTKRGKPVFVLVDPTGKIEESPEPGGCCLSVISGMMIPR